MFEERNLRRLATYCLMLLLAACNLNALDEPNLVVTVVPTRTLTLQDVESTEESSLPVATSSVLSEETEETCSPPADWYEYTVARGDNLTRIAQITNSTVDELIAANCLDDPNRLRVGDTIRVPNEPE
jgi:LysM repeat protein